jgi:hypothetical protein
MLSEHHPLIVNVIGHMLGAILFGIFLVLALRRGAGQHPQNKLLPVASAFLAFFWNAGSFFSIVLPRGPTHWVTEAASFCSLSLLPAVLLHLSLDGRFRRIAVAGYVVSGTATAMHLGEGLDPHLPLHRWALLYGKPDCSATGGSGCSAPAEWCLDRAQFSPSRERRWYEKVRMLDYERNAILLSSLFSGTSGIVRNRK